MAWISVVLYAKLQTTGHSNCGVRPHRRRTGRVEEHCGGNTRQHRPMSQSESHIGVLYNGPASFPLKIALSAGGSGPHLMHGSMGPYEFVPGLQTASRSVRPCAQHTQKYIPYYARHVRNRPHDRIYTHSVRANGAIWPKTRF